MATLADRIMSAVATIRADDVLSSWFTPDNVAIPLAASPSSAHIDAIAAGASQPTRPARAVDPAVQGWGQWLIRTSLSLLAMPMANVAEERVWVEEVVAPALVAALPAHDRSSPRPIREAR